MPLVVLLPILIIIVAVVAVFAVGGQRNSQENGAVGDANDGTNLHGAEPAPQDQTLAEQAYADGTYTNTKSYFTPKRVEHIITTILNLQDGSVVAVEVLYDGEKAKTPSHLNFDEAYEPEVLGRKLDDITLSRTGGASLTTIAFNEALEEIKEEARNAQN